MAITRTQQAKQMLQSGGEVLGPLGEDDNLQSGFVSGARRLITPGNIGRGLAFILSGGASSASEIAKEIARQKAIDELQKKTGDMIRPKIQTELMQRQNEMMGIGGYQSDFAQDSGFMGGKGTPAEMGSFAVGGLADGNFDFESARQMYGLGKLVKKVTRTVKKIAKSPVGKAALLYAGTAGLGALGAKFGTGVSGTGFGIFKPSNVLANLGASKAFLADKFLGPQFVDTGGEVFRSGGLFSKFPGGGVGAAIVGTSVLAGLTPKEKIQAQELAEEEGIDLEAAKNSILAARREQYMMDFRSRGFRAEGSPKEGEKGIMKMASAPDPMDALNDMAQMLFGKNLDELTDEEYDELQDAARDAMSEGGSMKEREGIMKMASYGYDDAMGETFEEFLRLKRIGEIPADMEFDEYMDLLDIDIPLSKKDKDSPSIKLAEGGKPEPVAKKTMPLLDMGGKEMDLREEGGFVPIGRMEKADDVPARLSKNEFVFTADAVRNAGDGDVDKGAEVMYNMMKNLEAGGEVSEESQGLEGARKMFQTSQRLEEVL